MRDKCIFGSAIIVIVILVIALFYQLPATNVETNAKSEIKDITESFVLVHEQNDSYFDFYIYKERKTGNLYTVASDSSGISITPMYNTDGSPLQYYDWLELKPE